MIKLYLFFILGLIAFLTLPLKQSVAFVVQKPKQALSFKNVGRDAAISKNKAPENLPLQKNEDVSIDYDEIADKLLPDQEPKKFYIDMRNKSAQNISAKPGQSFFVVLPEKEESAWLLDGNFKLAEIVSSEHNKNKRILEFRTICCGEGLFFLDNVSSDKNIALQSKIIRLRVRKK